MAQSLGCGRDAKLAFASESMGETSTEAIRRWNRDLPVQGNCQLSSNASFRQRSSLLRSKTKSRLMDLPEEQDPGSERMVNSGVFGEARNDREDDDVLDGDFLKEYKRMKLGTMTILQWISLVLMIVALACSLSVPVVKKQTMWDLQLWKWEVMILVLFCGRLISGWGIRVVVFVIERNFLLRKRVLYFVYGLRKAVQNCLWLGLVLIAWLCIFDEKVERETHSRILPYVTKILVSLLVSTLLWLLKISFVKILASSFHVNAFFDRIQESLFNQYVIETLLGPPLIETPNRQVDEERVMVEVQAHPNARASMAADLWESLLPKWSRRIIGSGGLEESPVVKTHQGFSRAMSKKQDQRIKIDHLHKLTPQNVSAWNMKRLMKIFQQGSLSTLDEKILDSDVEDDSSLQIRSERQAREAAKKIFSNVAKRDSEYIYLEDLLCFMTEFEALKTMHLFERAAQGTGISKKALKNWMVDTFKERRALALSLNDTKTSVDELHHILDILVAVISVVVWLLILGIATTHFLVFISSQFLLVVFIFGNTCKTIFEAIIFLFVMHPFDVGDRCEVDGVQMEVEEMNILTTVFLRYDKQKIRYPNSVLATKPIGNYYRSPEMIDEVDFSIHISTPMDKIAIMKEKIKEYIESKSDHWHPAARIILKDMEDMNKLKMALWVTHRMNHQDMGKRWTRRTLLVEEMIRIFRKLDIEYRLLPLNVNVQHMPDLISNRFPSNWTACAS